MYDLLKINNVLFPVPEGVFDITYSDITYDSEAEDGKTVVEVVREDIAKISVSYGGLLESTANTLLASLSTVNTVSFLRKGTVQTCQMKASNIRTGKKYYKNSLSLWSLSFELQEI